MYSTWFKSRHTLLPVLTILVHAAIAGLSPHMLHSLHMYMYVQDD